MTTEEKKEELEYHEWIEKKGWGCPLEDSAFEAATRMAWQARQPPKSFFKEWWRRDSNGVLFLLSLTLVGLTAIMMLVLGCGDYQPRPDGDAGADTINPVHPASYCGNYVCETGENISNCFEDCDDYPRYCGDNRCTPPESVTNCFEDCRPYGYKEDKKFDWPWDEEDKPKAPRLPDIPGPLPPK